MPFQSEKQRRYLHANHPEIAKRWERDYANGGISNHFRRKFDEGAYGRSYNPGAGGVVQHGPVNTKTGNGGGNQGGGGGPKPHSGPTFAEIQAQKKAAAAAAAAALEKKNLAAWEHSQTLKQNKKERIKKTKYLKGLLKNDPLYDVYAAQGLLDWDNIKPYESDPRLKTDESLKAKQKGWWGYTRPYLGGGENLYISNLEEFGQEPKGPLHATRSGRWNETIAEKNKRIAETIGHEARHQVLGADVPQIIGDPYSGKVNEALYEQGFLDENTFDLPGKGTHELINTMGDFQAFNNPGIYNDIYGTIHGDMPRHLSSPVADQLYDASTQFTKDTKARHEGEKYQNIDPIMIEGYADTLIKDYPEEVQGLSRSEVVQKLKQEADQMGTKGVMDVLYSDYLDNKEYAKGGVARKNYYHGGILDITGDEEITTDDGNDIELTAFNAAFDDPNDLSTGVKSLFQAKDGGTPQLAKKSKDGKRPGYGGPHDSYDAGQSYSGGNQGSDQGHSRFEPGSGYYGEPVTTSAPSTGDGPKVAPGEGPVTQAEIDLFNKGERTDPDALNMQDYLTDEQEVNEQKIQERNEAWLDENPRWKDTIDQHKNLQYKKNIDALVDSINNQLDVRLANKAISYVIEKAALAHPITAIAYGIAKLFGWKPPTVSTDLSGNIIDKNYVTGADLGFFDPDEYPEFWGKGPDDGGDGPEVPQIVPIHEEIQEYEDIATQAMSPFDMKARQTLNAQLQNQWEQERLAKEQEYRDYGLIADNPIVLNKGGLANLFRVKNQ